MLVTLILKNGINKIVLPENPIGNYWLNGNINGKEEKLVNIEGVNKHWKVYSSSKFRIINPKFVSVSDDDIKYKNTAKGFLPEMYIEEYNTYAIKFENSNEIGLIYCSPIYESNFTHLNIVKTNQITIGSSAKNHIIYDNILTASVHARIFYNHGRLSIENYDQKFGTYVNNIPVRKKSRMLFNGDVVFIMGLKIIVIGNSIVINNPQGKASYNAKFFEIYKNASEYDEALELDFDDDAVELYSDKDYFSRSPRITNIIETAKVKIDSPPNKQTKEEMPVFLALGSSLSMSLVMVFSIVSQLQRNGDDMNSERWISIASTAVILLGILLFPILTMRWDKRSKRKTEVKRQLKYLEYLKKKREEINVIKSTQRSILMQNYVEPEMCAEIILNRDSRLWERKIESPDFLTVKVGNGDVKPQLEVQYPEERFEVEEDTLLEVLYGITNDSKWIKDAPITLSLVEKRFSSFVVRNDEVKKKYIQLLILQLITFHSYEDLKFVFLVKKSNDNFWDFVKMLPHTWDNPKEFRFFAEDYIDMKEISKYLEEDFSNRAKINDDKIDYKNFSPYYLIITDDYKGIENLKITKDILGEKKNLGFSMFCITDDISELPNECKAFITLDNKTKGMLFENELSSNNQRQFSIKMNVTIFFDRLYQTISNIPIRYANVGSFALPQSYSFLEMYDVGMIEQLNILDRWRKNDSTRSLQAPIGIDSSGMPIVLDIHEKFHGPHGLIAGSTGSGKSDFIITYILSLAINYHPDDLSFLLIDYKGGGLAGAFKKRNIVLPHLVGTITNIETSELQRSEASIQSELRRRQIIFNEARNKTDEGTIDIYKYQKLYHEGIVSEPIPHLLIICDEFAELKQQQEEFMDELISVSRIGRSLGVHLILATQKPAGVVNDQIRSNSKFAVCLKVQDASDSNDVIKKPLAAGLKNPGQFYMQVGSDDYFVLGQSAWTGAPYYPSDTTKKRVDSSIQFISNIGTSIKEVDNKKHSQVESGGEQLTNILKYIYGIAEGEKIKPRQLWLDNIPADIYIDNVVKKYHRKIQATEIKATIGEYDDPYNQKQGPLQINLSTNGNVAIYGNAESGKESLINTLIYNLISTYSSDQVQFYLLDYGSESLKIFNNSKHVGDVIYSSDIEKTSRYFDMIEDVIKTRKSVLSDYNGDYAFYLKKSGKPMPMLVNIINNYPNFSEAYEDAYEERFQSITREGRKCGVVFIVTLNGVSDMRYRLTQNFKQKYALQLNNDDDYYGIYDSVGKKRPSHIFGRGLAEVNPHSVLEFQTAKICDAIDFNEFIENRIIEINSINKSVAKPVPTMPFVVTLNSFRDLTIDVDQIPIGITAKDLKVFKYNFAKEFATLITSKMIDNAVKFAYNVIVMLDSIPNVKTIIFNPEMMGQNLKEKYDGLINTIKENSDKTVVCFFMNIDKLFLQIDYSELDFAEKLSELESLKAHFVLVDSTSKLKNHQYDSWYKIHMPDDTGIYIGNGIDNQYILNVTERRDVVNNCGSTFGYAVNQGVPKCIKCIGMIEEGE